MSWYSLGLAGGLEDFSEEAWRLAWEISQAETGPDDSSAIFKKPGTDHRLNLYFTPSSRSVAETFGARRCEKPSPAGMSLVAGSGQAWEIHFGRVFGLRRRIQSLGAWTRRRGCWCQGWSTAFRRQLAAWRQGNPPDKPRPG